MNISFKYEIYSSLNFSFFPKKNRIGVLAVNDNSSNVSIDFLLGRTRN